MSVAFPAWAASLLPVSEMLNAVVTGCWLRLAYTANPCRQVLCILHYSCNALHPMGICRSNVQTIVHTAPCGSMSYSKGAD